MNCLPRCPRPRGICGARYVDLLARIAAGNDSERLRPGAEPTHPTSATANERRLRPRRHPDHRRRAGCRLIGLRYQR
jgi:hypothetical protein